MNRTVNFERFPKYGHNFEDEEYYGDGDEEEEGGHAESAFGVPDRNTPFYSKLFSWKYLF